jgi:hypothetical protein
MPIMNCNKDGKPGVKWGHEGHCYTYDPTDRESLEKAIEKAYEQAQAIYASGYKE